MARFWPNPIAIFGVLALASCTVFNGDQGIKLDVGSSAKVLGQPMPAWAEAAPTTADYATVYPERALEQKRDGAVRLNCLILPDRKLECAVHDEAPAGWDFANAALVLSRYFVVRAEAERSEMKIGTRVIVPILFRVAR
jgi:hypothetical protein